MPAASLADSPAAGPSFAEVLAGDVAHPDDEGWRRGVDLLSRRAPLERFPAGALLLEAGSHDDHAWLLAAGEVEIFVGDERLNRVGPGDLLGELALTTGRPRTASARALAETRAWRIERSDYEAALAHAPGLAALLKDKVYSQLSRRYGQLRREHEALLAAQAAHRSLAFLFVTLLVLISSYALLNDWLVHGLAVPKGSTLRFVFSRVLEVAALGILVTLIRRTGLGWADMGLRRAGTVRALAWGLLVTLPIMGALLAIRRAVWPPDAATPLVDWGRLDWTYATYLFFAPLQEWIARGVFQSTVERLLPWRRASLAAIAITALTFAMLHLHVSRSLAVVALLSGLLWGGLYSRQRNLAGAALSHFLLGNWAGVLGLWAVWQ